MASGTDLTDLEKLKGPVHFIGIGGIGMSALARLLLARGNQVSGSDKAASSITDELTQLGCDIHIGHDKANFGNIAILVVSTAIAQDNPELTKAKELGVPILHRSEMLSALTRGRRLIGVSGTHGKTTTTGMAAQALIDAKLDPCVVVGGVFNKMGSNARHGDGEYFVAEIDESDGTQTKVRSYISIITNIESDHLENYPGGLEEIVRAMKSFAVNTEKAVIVCGDDARCMALKSELSSGSVPVVTYGKRQSEGDNRFDFSFESTSAFGIKIYQGDQILGEIILSVPGEHNKYNVLATVAAGNLLGIDFAVLKESLATFSGVNRRFQILGEENAVLVVDDYAHHPTEVDATLKGAKQYIEQNRTAENGKRGRLIALFQPHQPSRLQNHWNEFVKCFDDADVVLVSDVYIARGKGIDGVNSALFAEAVKHQNVHYIAGQTSDLAAKVIPFLEPKDLIMTIGAGDITSVGPKILDLLKHKKS